MAHQPERKIMRYDSDKIQSASSAVRQYEGAIHSTASGAIGAQAASEREPSEIEREMDRLHNAVHEMRATVDLLWNRLAPVTDSTQNPEPANGVEVGCRSPLGNHIRSNSCLVSDSSASLHRLLQKLAI